MSGVVSYFGKIEKSLAPFGDWLGKSNTMYRILNPVNAYIDKQDEEEQKLKENIASIEAGRAEQEKSNLAAEAEARAVTEEDRKKRLRRSVSIYTSGMGDSSVANTKRGVLLGA